MRFIGRWRLSRVLLLSVTWMCTVVAVFRLGLGSWMEVRAVRSVAEVRVGSIGAVSIDPVLPLAILVLPPAAVIAVWWASRKHH